MINTTIPKVPSGLEPALNDFLNAVKKQIHIREGVNTKVKDDRFITFREANKLLDDRTQTLRKHIKKDTQFKRGDSDKIDLSPLKGELTNIKGRIEDIENSRVLDLQLKEGVFVNTFLHVGPDVPSDEGWNPEGVGITGAGIYGVGPEQEGHFFLGSYDISGDFGVMAPILGHEIWAGELRVGDDISYNSNTNLLNGSDWMWYRPGVGLSINIENGGGLTVGNHTTGTGIITGPEGLFVFDQGVMVHGFSTTDGIEVPHGNTIDRNDAMMGKYFSGTGLYWDDSAETFSIKVSSNNRRIEIDDLGILGYSSGDNLVFGFTLQDLPDIPAGTGVFTGRIFATDIVGQPGEGVTVRSDVFTDTRLELDERGLVGYLNNEIVFATFLDEVEDTPAGSLLARGHILLGKPDEGNGISFDAVNSQMQIYVGGSNRGIGIDENGFWGYDENNDVKIGFTFVDLPDIPAGSAYFAGILFNTRIVGQPGEGVTVQPDMASHRRIEIDDLGLLGYNSNNDIAFGFAFEQIGDIPAGSAVFQGNIYGSEIIGTDGLTIRKEPGSTARLELDSNGLLGYNSSNELLFGFALQDVGDIPEGSGVFKGTVYAGS